MPDRRPWCAALAAALVACSTAPRGPGPAVPPPDGAVALEEADAALRLARFDVAGAKYEEASRLAPRDPRPPLGLAKVRFASARIPEGLELLDRSIALGETPEALLLRGRTLGVARRFDAAARDLDRALALAPGDGSAWPTLAAIQVNLGDDVEARRAWDAAVGALGSSVAMDRLWTMLLAMPPDPLQPQESLDRCARGQAAMFQGRWPEAAHEQRNALRNAPGFAWCIALAAETAWRLGDPVGAERLFRRALAGYPDRLAHLRADSQARLAGYLLARGEGAGEAAELARSSLAVRGDRAATLDVLARACVATGDAAGARDASERLLRRPNLPDAMRSAAEERLRTAPPAREARPPETLTPRG
jgi:tetratricopeptide (TPR) repeat protein